MQMVERGILMDWVDFPNLDTKPIWVRHSSLIPCNCNNFFWCKHNYTTGVSHTSTSRQDITTGFPCSNEYEVMKTKNNKVACQLCLNNMKVANHEESYYEREKKETKTYKGCKED